MAPVSAFVDCNNIKNDLLAIETEIQNSCINKGSDGKCCPICVGDDCDKKIYDLQCIARKDLDALYNSKMAELIIEEGLTSIMLALANNHMALNDLKYEQIKKADDYINGLEQNLVKADLLYNGLKENTEDGNTGDRSTFFNKYSESKKNLDIFIKDNCQSPQFSHMKFCERVTFYKENHPDFYKEFLLTLEGFLQTDRKVADFDDARKVRYETYQEKLKIKVGDKLFTPDEFSKSAQYLKMKELKNLLSNYRVDTHSPETRKIKAKEILKKANALDRVDIHFNPTSTDNRRTTLFLQQQFDLPFAQVDMPALVIEGDFKEHFDHAITRSKLDKAQNEKALLTKSKEVGCYDVSCIESKCDASTSENVLWLCEELKIYKEQETAINHLNKAKSCLNEKKFNDKKTCLMGLGAHQKSLKTLRKELADLEKARWLQDNNENFKKLNIQKSMGIYALEKNSCRDHSPYTIDGVHETDCLPQKTLVPDYEAYQMSLNGQKISLQYENQLLKETLASLKVNDKDLTQKFVKDCQEENHSQNSLCQYYVDNDLWKQRLDNEYKARKNIVRMPPPEDEGPDYTGIATDQLIKSSALYSVPLISSYAQTWMMQSSTKSAINSIKTYDDFYMSYYKSYMEGQNNTQYTNYGLSQFGTSYNDYSNFQLNNQSTIFKNPSNLFQSSLTVPSPVNLSQLIQAKT